MATLEINGRDVEVDDSFLSLSPEQQNATVDEIATSLGASPAAAPKPGTREYANWAREQAMAGKELPTVSKPAPEWKDPNLTGPMGKFDAAYTSFVNGMPIAGPTLLKGMESLRSMAQGMPVEQVQAEGEAAREANPITSTAAGIGGAVAGLAPLGATALGGRLLGMTGSLGSRVALGGASGGLISAADSAARGGDAQDNVTGGLVGAGIGAAFPVVGAALRRAVTPVASNATKRAAADVLEREGVDLTAGQRTGSKALQYREAELTGSAGEDFIERQADQFTAAALRRVGVDAPRATPDVVDAAFTNIGQQFDDLAARNGLQTDPRLLQDLQRAWREFENVTNANSRPPFVENFMRDIQDRMRTGYAFLDGEWFKSTRSELGRLARNSSNPEFAEALRDIQAALDNGMERSLRQVNPADLGAWQEARRLYRNMIVVEDAIGRAGEKSADGIITPANLRNAAMRQNKRGFVRGRSEFTELANAGVSGMTPLPNSGTAGRIGAKMLLPAGTLTGAAIGNSIAPGIGLLVGGAAGAATPWAIGRGMLSGPGRAYLGNQMLPGLGAARLPPAVLSLLGTQER